MSQNECRDRATVVHKKTDGKIGRLLILERPRASSISSSNFWAVA